VVPPGLESHVYINFVIDVLADAYTLGDGARSILQKVLSKCHQEGNHSPTATDLLREVDTLPLKGRATGWRISVARALESVEFSSITSAEKTTQEKLAQSLLERSTIVELDSLSHNSKKFLIPILCLWLYCVRLNQPDREKLRLVIFIEEAHHVLYRQEQRSKESLMNMLLRQCREMGIAFVVVDQHPHLISSAALGNTYTTICLNQKHPTDINRAAGICLLDDSDKKFLSLLPVGQGIVKLQDRWRKPVLVQFPLVRVKKGSVTDSALKASLAGSGTLSGVRRSAGKEFEGKGDFRTSDMYPGEDAWRFLEDVLQHPDDGVAVRYRRLGISSDKGNRLKEQLIRQAMLESQEVSAGRTRRVLLRPTPDARRKLGLDIGHSQRGSLAHEYWKHVYAEKLTKEGYDVTLEAPRKGGRVDVLACKGKTQIAVEIETGKSDAVTNVRQDLLTGFTKVLVVATDRRALVKIERQLGKAGLLIARRVNLVLRDERRAVT